MITAFEVGAVFRIINKASPTLTAMLRQVRALNDQIEKAKLALADLAKGTMLPSTTGMNAAIAQTQDLALAWKDVAKNAGQARAALGSATVAATRSGGAVAAIGSGGAGGRGSGRRMLGSWLHGGVRNPGMHLPTGSSVHLAGIGGASLAGLGYGAYQAAEMEDFVTKILYTEGLSPTEANKQKFRDIIQKAMSQTGYSLHDVGSATLKELQMMQGTPGGGVDILPEMLKAAATESRMKGSSLDESINALIGLAHMTKSYDPKEIAKMVPAFAFLSTANPSSLNSMEKAASYAVPMLQSGMDIDPLQSLLLGTALTRAGANATKSGTWLRNMMLMAMPGTSSQSKTSFKKHEAALKALGLVDDNGQPTWFTNGKPDPYKMLDIAGTKAQAMPLAQRAGIEKQLFGLQGAGGFSLLAHPKVQEQINNLNAELNANGGPEAFNNRYANFMQNYQANSPIQQGRTALADFNIALMDIGSKVLPAVSGALKDFQGAIQTITKLIPGASSDGGSTVGKRAIEGAAGGAVAGAAIGAFGGPVGMAGGAVLGAAAGGVYGIAEQYMKTMERPIDKFGRQVVITGNAAAQSAEGMKALGDAIRGLPSGALGFQGAPHAAPASPLHKVSLTLNLDGRTLAQAMSEQLMQLMAYPTGAPVGNDSATWASGDAYSDDI